MTDLPPAVAVYQLHASLLEISPAIWCRLRVRSDTTIADLHYIRQIAFDWTGSHLHRFVIYGKDYGIAQLGDIGFGDNPRLVRLCDLRLHINSRFRYEYDFGDLWQHQIRLERILPLEDTCRYPSCTGGCGAAPPEDCGGPWAFLALKQHYTPVSLAHQLPAILQNEPDELDVDGEGHTALPWCRYVRRTSRVRLAITGTNGEVKLTSP